MWQLTPRVYLILGITGVGLVVPGATPGTVVGEVPGGSAVVVPSGVGDSGKPGKAEPKVSSLKKIVSLLMIFCLLFKDAGPSGTAQPGMVQSAKHHILQLQHRGHNCTIIFLISCQQSSHVVCIAYTPTSY